MSETEYMNFREIAVAARKESWNAPPVRTLHCKRFEVAGQRELPGTYRVRHARMDRPFQDDRQR